MRRKIATAALILVGIASQASAASCPTEVRFEPGLTAATIDFGWFGSAHRRPVPAFTLDLAVTCAANEPPCGTCTITGLADEPVGGPLRCAADSALACTVATAVDDCGAADGCRYYPSPPQPLASSLPLCLVPRLSGAIGGTVGAETGELTVSLTTDTTLHSAISFDHPCPRCDGDAVPNDGTRDGTCDAGPHAGAACDAGAVSPYPDFGATSLDCPPNEVLSIGVLRIPQTLTTTPPTVTLTAASPNCTANPSKECFCSTCNNANSEACFTDAECPSSGGQPGRCGGRRCMNGPDLGQPCNACLGGTNNGAACSNASQCPGGTCAGGCTRVCSGGPNDGATCTANSECPAATCPTSICNIPGEPTKPNRCFDDPMTMDDCVPDGNGHGSCIDGPVVSSCSNHPGRGCLNDADCDGVPGACQFVNALCYVDQGVIGGSVTADAVATPPVDGVADPTALGALACVPPSGSALTNNANGLPGLQRTEQSGRLLLGANAIHDLCPPTPASCRVPATPGKSSVQLDDRAPGATDQLRWKWIKGAATTLAELGDPTTGLGYALCLYDAGGLRTALRIPGGGLCAKKPCWKANGNGFVYRDKEATPDGVTQLTLRPGPDGKAQISLKGARVGLPIPALPSVSGALTVQLRNRTSGLCFGTTFSPPFQTQTPTRLKDKAD